MNLQENIKKVLREYWVKPKQDNTRAEKIINMIMSKKYPWWGKLTIEEFSHSKLPPYSLTIYGTLKVDEEWAANRWIEQYDYKPFPGKQIDEDDNSIRLGDIISNKFSSELSNYMEAFIPSITEYDIVGNIRIGYLKLKFV